MILNFQIKEIKQNREALQKENTPLKLKANIKAALRKKFVILVQIMGNSQIFCTKHLYFLIRNLRETKLPNHLIKGSLSTIHYNLYYILFITSYTHQMNTRQFQRNLCILFIKLIVFISKCINIVSMFHDTYDHKNYNYSILPSSTFSNLL